LYGQCICSDRGSNSVLQLIHFKNKILTIKLLDKRKTNFIFVKSIYIYARDGKKTEHLGIIFRKKRVEFGKEVLHMISPIFLNNPSFHFGWRRRRLTYLLIMFHIVNFKFFLQRVMRRWLSKLFIYKNVTYLIITHDHRFIYSLENEVSVWRLFYYKESV
jgi:hypothetical protein